MCKFSVKLHFQSPTCSDVTGGVISLKITAKLKYITQSDIKVECVQKKFTIGYAVRVHDEIRLITRSVLCCITTDPVL